MIYLLFLFLFACEKMGFEPKNSMVVEDSKLGIQAAKSAGMIAIGYAPEKEDQKTLKENGADFVITSLQEVLKLQSDSLEVG